MSGSGCDHLLPTHDLALTPDGGIHECLLPKDHDGEHLVRLPDDRHILWEWDLECDCSATLGDESCECFLWHEVSGTALTRLLKPRKCKK